MLTGQREIYSGTKSLTIVIYWRFHQGFVSGAKPLHFDVFDGGAVTFRHVARLIEGHFTDILIGREYPVEQTSDNRPTRIPLIRHRLSLLRAILPLHTTEFGFLLKLFRKPFLLCRNTPIRPCGRAIISKGDSHRWGKQTHSDKTTYHRPKQLTHHSTLPT